MTKIVVLGDLHIGARGGSIPVAEFQIKFFEDQLFPYLSKNNIKNVIQLGDVFDVRKNTSHIILDMWKRRVFDYMKAKKINFNCLVGNHDSGFKNTIEINSPNLFLNSYENVRVFSSPEDLKIDNFSILMVPWICQDNEAECLEAIKTTNSTWVAGHFEFAGYQMHKGQEAHDGMSISGFEKFSGVISGHYHTRNLPYVGTPYEMSWIDYGDQKGFHVLDTDRDELAFISNKFCLFNKIVYDDTDENLDYKEMDISKFVNSYVKVIVIKKQNLELFDFFIGRLSGIQTLDLKIVEDISSLDSDSIDDVNISIQDTKTLIEQYIDASEFDMNKEELKKLMTSLYVESLNCLE